MKTPCKAEENYWGKMNCTNAEGSVKTRVVKKIPVKTAGLAGPSATALGCSNIT